MKAVQALAQANKSLRSLICEIGEKAQIEQSGNQTFTVGVGGDFEKLSTALEYLSHRYVHTATRCPRFILMIKSGTVIDEQIFVSGTNYQTVSIKSEDDEVPVDASKMLTKYGDMFAAFNAVHKGSLPHFATTFKFINIDPQQTNLVGFQAYHGGFIRISKGGFKNTTRYAMKCQRCSTIHAESAVFDQSNDCAFYIDDCSNLLLNQVNISNTNVCAGIVHRNSKLNIVDSDISNVQRGLFIDECSSMYAKDVSMQNVATELFNIQSCSKAFVTGCTYLNYGTDPSCQYDVYINKGSTFSQYQGSQLKSNVDINTTQLPLGTYAYTS